MMIDNTTLRAYAIIVTISLEEIKNHGTALMKNFTQQECVKTATLITTIARRD